MEAQNLLKWLATSQAAEDINSDDELACETIVSPLLPAATIDKMLEKANMAYESESQQECQDILDSIDDMDELDLPKKKPPPSFDHNCPVEASSESMIPQVDGSNDDEFSSPCANLAGTSSAVEINSEYKRASEYHLLHNTNTRTVTADKRNRQWGSLPFSMTGKVNNDGEHTTSQVAHLFESETRDSALSDYLTRNEVKNNTCIKRNVGEGASDSKEVHSLVSCSIRDLMRRKRSYRVEHDELESGTAKKLILDRHGGPKSCLWQKLESEIMQTDELETELQTNSDHEVSSRDNFVCGKQLLPSGSDSFFNISKDECLGQHERGCIEASMVLRNSTNQSSSSMHEGPDLLETSHFIDTMDKPVACREKNTKDGTTYAKPVASDAYTPSSSLDAQLRTDDDHNVRAPERCQQTDSAASGSRQNSLIDDEVSGKSNCMDKKSCGSICFVQHEQMKSYEHAVGKSAASDTRVLRSEKVDNQKLDKKLLCETVGSEPIVDDLKSNQVKLTEITIGNNSSVDKNIESNLSLQPFSDTHLHLDEDDEMAGFNYTFFNSTPHPSFL
jgi:DNA polymerase zeta